MVALARALRAERVRGIVIGGIAASLLGRPRTTRDVDAVVWIEAVAHRPRDAADIEGLLDANPALDRAHVLRWVREFAEVLEAPELLSDLEAIMRRAVPARRPRRRAAKIKSGR